MKAVRIHENGGPEVLRYEEVPEPEIGAGQVRVRVEAAGLNYIDVYFREGRYPSSLPFTLGLEGAGTIEAVGDGVRDLTVGDRVAWAGVLGSCAELCAVPAERAVPVPSGVDTSAAAAAMLQGMTAHYLACSTWPLRKGETCLVHAAAGGVGLLLCQVATMQGARVIGTCSTGAKAELARKAGADEVILYTKEDFAEAVKRLTGGAGVEVVYDSVGRTTFEKSLDCLKPRGMLVLYGQSSGPVESLDPQILNWKGSLFLTRPSLAHYTASREELRERAGAILGWMREGRLDVRIDREIPLEQAADAHRALEGRETTGKVLLLPATQTVHRTVRG